MALQFGERLGARAPHVAKNLGDSNLGVVVENRLRNAAQPGKCGDMPVQKGFGRLGRVGFDEDGIRMRQVQTEVVNPCLDAAQIDVGFAEIDLGTAGRMRQRDKNFLLSQAFLGHEFAHHGVAALIAVFITQALEDPNGGVALFLENVTVVQQDLIDDADEGAELRRYRWVFALITRRHGMTEHLADGLAADAKPFRCGALALVLDHHGTPYFGV